jgi:hypothetical protein
MKKAAHIILTAFLGILLVGCGTSKEIKMKSVSERKNVFQELEGEEIPRGSVELIIKASLKTHLKGLYLFEGGRTYHGEGNYPFLINIDGQAVTWWAKGEKEVTPRFDSEGNYDPERGEGIKYILEKKIALAPGPHKFFFALPSEDYFKELEFDLEKSRSHVLEFKPVYRQSNNYPRFIDGVKEFIVYLDDKVLACIPVSSFLASLQLWASPASLDERQHDRHGK